MNDQEVWTSGFVPDRAFRWVEFDDGSKSIEDVKFGLCPVGVARFSAPIPSAEELAAMREVCEAARRIVQAVYPSWGLDTSGIEDLSDNDWGQAHSALQRLAAARAKGGATC